MTTATCTKTKTLTTAQKRALRTIFEHQHYPNAIRVDSLKKVFTTPKGNNALTWLDHKSTMITLVDQGLVEMVLGDGYTYSDGYPAVGIIRLTEKGIAALESGKYEGETLVRPARDPNAPQATQPSPYADLPRILFLECISDGGPDGGACCPHCGAIGRWIYHFACEGGVQAAAMRGCFGNWPKHRFVELAAGLIEKEKEYRERSAKGREWKLASWNQDILTAIRNFADGTCSEEMADQRIRDAQIRKASWMRRKYGGR